MKTASAKPDETSARSDAMALLSRAIGDELSAPLRRHWPEHGARDLKRPEIGLVMLRGRAGGDGAPFNLGEATVAKAVVALPTGERGYGHVLGRDLARARDAAILDALWQRVEARETVQRHVLAPIAARLAATRAKSAAETAATKVDFFTLVRGEDLT